MAGHFRLVNSIWYFYIYWWRVPLYLTYHSNGSHSEIVSCRTHHPQKYFLDQNRRSTQWRIECVTSQWAVKILTKFMMVEYLALEVLFRETKKATFQRSRFGSTLNSSNHKIRKILKKFRNFQLLQSLIIALYCYFTKNIYFSNKVKCVSKRYKTLEWTDVEKGSPGLKLNRLNKMC